jgi:response regulator RpfG family c-di-GMP phosphodiesterase
MSKHLLLVDDDPVLLDSLRRRIHARRPTWKLTCADRSITAWEKLLECVCDALVVDIWMPGLSGLELLERVRMAERTHDLPVVVLTGLSHQRLKQRAMELGASDLLNKPVDTEQLLATLDGLLSAAGEAENAPRNEAAKPQRHARRAQLWSRLELVCRLARLADRGQEEGANHAIRVGCSSGALAEQMGHGVGLQERLLLAAPLHDIGNIAIPQQILEKPGPLDPAERAVVEGHCLIGERLLRDPEYAPYPGLVPGLVKCRDTAEDPFLLTAATIALTHHEHWDGSGYPRGLAGMKIPLEARIVAICDAFDALTSRRSYRKPHSEMEALRIIDESGESQFDPAVRQAFHEALPEIRAVREEFADGVAAFPELEKE